MAARAETIEMRVIHSTIPVWYPRAAPLELPPEEADDPEEDPEEPEEPEDPEELPEVAVAAPVAALPVAVIPREAKAIPLEIVGTVTQLEDEGMNCTVEGVTRSPTV